MRSSLRLSLAAALMAALLLPGCNSKRAHQVMEEPVDDSYDTGFRRQAGKDSKRETPEYQGMADDMLPEHAVKTLVGEEHLQSQERWKIIRAEDELRYWGSKQGVGPVVAKHLRPLLHHERLEVRAPALRLTILFGRKDSIGDLIEVLDDKEYAMRSTSFKALRVLCGGRDFRYNPSGGAVDRARALHDWRQWWDEHVNGPREEPVTGLPETPEGREHSDAAPEPAGEKRDSEVLLPVPKDIAEQPQ